MITVVKCKEWFYISEDTFFIKSNISFPSDFPRFMKWKKQLKKYMDILNIIEYKTI